MTRMVWLSVFRCLTTSVLVLILTACGGGGASDTSNGGVNLHPTLQLQVSTLFAAVLPGYSLPLTLDAEVNGGPSDNSIMYMVIRDPAGVIESASVPTVSANINSLAIILNPALAAGRYTGTATVSLCKTADCATSYFNAALPYDLILESSPNLTTLAPLPGVSDWKIDNGDNAHDGYVPVTLDPTKFTPRWILSGLYASGYPVAGLSGDAPVTDSAKHLIVARTDMNVQRGLAAYSEVDGHEIWNVSISNQIDDLALYNGVIYALVSGNLQAIDDSTGSTLFTVAAGVPRTGPGALLVVGNVVFVGPGSSFDPGVTSPEPIKAFDATNGAPVWSGPGLSDMSPLAADSTDLYFYVSNAITPGALGVPGFSAVDLATGNLQWQIPRAADPTGAQSVFGNQKIFFYGATPVVDGAGGAVEFLADGGLGAPIERYDLTSKQLIWTTGLSPSDTLYLGATVVSQDTVYAAVDVGPFQASHVVNALDLNTGARRWSWSPPAPDYQTIRSLLVTKNILFVGTGTATYAVDLATHETVWIFPLQGRSLSLSPSGILYIGSAAYGTNPFNLQPGAMAAINLE